MGARLGVSAPRTVSGPELSIGAALTGAIMIGLWYWWGALIAGIILHILNRQQPAD